MLWQVPPPQRPSPAAPQMEQSATGCGWQRPATQEAAWQSLKSVSQLVPSSSGTAEQTPSMQAPALQASSRPGQAVPLSTGKPVQLPSTQAPTLQGSSAPTQSVPLETACGAQRPAAQTPRLQSVGSFSHASPSKERSQETQAVPSKTESPQAFPAHRLPASAMVMSSIQTASEPTAPLPSLR